MEQTIRSWIMTDKPNHIGRKQVDWSIFEYGSHIPIEFHRNFEVANGEYHLERGASHSITLLIENQQFEAMIYNVDRKNVAIDTLQIRYDSNNDIKNYLKEKFRVSYEFLQQDRAKKSSEGVSGNSKVPEAIAEYIDFYQTDKPFVYQLRLSTAEESLINEVKNKSSREPNIWWVNQGDSFTAEKEAGVLWAPQKGKDGRTFYHWDTMKEVQEEDIVIHYSNGAIRCISQVLSASVEAMQPESLHNSYAERPGHLVELNYHDLNQEIPLVEVAEDLMNLNIHQGPIDVTGNVKQGYLFRLTMEAFKIILQTKPKTIWPEFVCKYYVEQMTSSDCNYWIFQANPKNYRVVEALRDGEIKTWRVAAHKNKIKPGDKVIIWVTGNDAGCYALATVSSGVYKVVEHTTQYSIDQSQATEEYEGCELKLDYVMVDNPIAKQEVKENPKLQGLKVGFQGTNFVATKEQYQELLRIVQGKDSEVIEEVFETNELYTMEQLIAETGLSTEEVSRWIRAIERKGQAIIYGPPGTGKTYVAEKLARHFLSEGDGFFDLVQFHPAYSYEDFMQGIRPQTRDDGGLMYPMVPGRFLDFCREARRRTGQCVLIIDEINRANLARVFGELMYLLEYRGREIPLAGGGTLSIPRNAIIIGTMNTADRSIALVDHALRRRFAFLSLQPNYDVMRKYHKDINLEGLITELIRLNKRINDPHYEIGISFFLVDDLKTQIEDIWRMEIEPYLEEYFYDQPEIVNDFRWDKIGDKIRP